MRTKRDNAFLLAFDADDKGLMPELAQSVKLQAGYGVTVSSRLE